MKKDRRKKYLKQKNRIKSTVRRTLNRRIAELFRLAHEGGKEGKRAMRLLMGFRLNKAQQKLLKDLWVKDSLKR